MMRNAGILLLAVAWACREEQPAATHEEAARRIPSPRPNPVRALPPFAVRATGVGPYKLGEALPDLLQEPPYGVTVFDAPGLVRLNVIHAEQGGVVAGGSPLAPASFVAVVRPGMAQIERGADIGTTAERLHEIMGRPVAGLADRRGVVFARAPQITFLVGTHVEALLVSDERPPNDRCAINPVVRDMSLPQLPHRGCGNKGVMVAWSEHGAALVSDRAAEHGPITPLAGLIAVGPGVATEVGALRVEGTPSSRTWYYVSFRREGNRLVRTGEQVLYELTTERVAVLAATLADVDLVVRVSDGVAGGLLVVRRTGVLSEVLPLVRRPVNR